MIPAAWKTIKESAQYVGVLRKAKVLNPAEYFQLQGWGKKLIKFTETSESNAIALAGNMITIPVIGAILATILGNLKLDVNRKYYKDPVGKPFDFVEFF